MSLSPFTLSPFNLSRTKPHWNLFSPPSTQFLSVGNPTLSLESYAPDVVEEETEEDLEDEINRDGVEDCNSIGSLREEGEGDGLPLACAACHTARETRRSQAKRGLHRAFS